MRSLLVLMMVGSLAVAAATDMVKLVTFDGQDKETTWKWKVLNDPVMGGQSTSVWAVNTTEGAAVWDGETKIVPSLKAPGFCNAETTNGLGVFTRAKDASPFDHLLLRVRSTVPYTGFKVSFAADTINPQFKSFKSVFNVTRHDGVWHTVAVPFKSFSNDWSSYTGLCGGVDPNGKKHVCCSTAHPEVCPTAKNLKDISQFGLWTEGVAGKFHLEVQWIAAGTGAAAEQADQEGGAAADAVIDVDDDTPCCQGPCDASKGLVKYYSLASGNDGTPHCGETCLDPKYYNIFHFFEKNLTKAASASPCRGFGYTKYDETVTHGVWPIRCTLDLYNKA